MIECDKVFDEVHEDKICPFVPSTPARIEYLLDFIKLIEGDTLMDLGCGDGRVLITAAKRFGCKVIGVDID